MGDVKVYQVSAVNKTRRIGRHGSFKSDTNKAPFSDITGTNTVGDKEELVGTLDDLLSQDGCRRNCWSGAERCGGWWSRVEAWYDV